MKLSCRYSVFVILLLMLAFCKEDFIGQEFPTVLSVNASFNGTAMILSGEVISRNADPLDETGFIWQSGYDPKVNPGFRISVSPVVNNGKFNYSVFNSIKGNTDYFFRAYAKQHGYTVYGDAVHFRLTQDLTQSLFQVTPSTGQAGDTVTIKGGLFNLTAEKNSVSFESFSSKIVSVKDSLLKCIVPITLNTRESTIFLTIDGVASQLNQKFILTTPVITSFTPSEARYLDTISINGSGFHRIESLNLVRFAGKEAIVLSASFNQLKVTVPIVADSLCQISVSVSGQVAVSQSKIKVSLPKVDSYYPSHAGYLDTIEIYCKNIRPEQVLSVKFGNLPAEIIGNSGSILKIKVPPNIVNEKSTLTVSVTGGDFNFPDKFTLDQPVINSISTVAAGNGAPFSINGDNFSPASGINKIILKDSVTSLQTSLKVMYVSKDSLVALITKTDNSIVPNGTYYIGVQTCENIIWSDLRLSVMDMWLRLADFPGGERYKGAAFSINGKGYAGMGTLLGSQVQNDLWEFDPNNGSWTRKADLPGPGRIFPCVFQTQNEAYAGGGQSLDNSSQVPYTDFYKFDPSLNNWTRMVDIPNVEKSYPGASADPTSSIHVANLSTGSIMEYNSNLDAWVQTYNGNAAALREPQIFALNGKVYFVGGINNQLTNGTNNQVWEYTPSIGAMTRKNDFPGASRYGGFSFSIGNYGYIGCGISATYIPLNVVYLTDVWRYDPINDSWTSIGTFPGGFRHTMVNFVIGKKAYILTGWNNVNLTKDVWQFYDPINK